MIISGIVLLNLESINRPGKIVTFFKLEAFQVDKSKEISKFVNVTGVQSVNY